MHPPYILLFASYPATIAYLSSLSSCAPIFRLLPDTTPPHSMHRALRVPELVSLIAKAVSTPRHKSTLARLAQVSKTFLDPALDTLWREQYSILPLLMLFPEDLCCPGPQLTFSRPMWPEDWTRFLIYAPRIRTLIVSERENENQVDPSVFQSLALHRPKLYFLPNLTEMTWFFTSLFGLQNTMLFMSPSLRDVTIRHEVKEFGDDGWGELMSAVIKHLASIAVRLRNLDVGRLFDSPQSVDTWTACTALIHRFPALEDVTMPLHGSASSTAMTHLCALPNMHTLHLCVSDEVSDTYLQSFSTPPRALQRMTRIFLGMSPRFATSWLGSTSNIPLSAFYLSNRASRRYTPQQIHDLALVLRKSCHDAYSMQTFSLYIEPIVEFAPPEEGISIGTIEPLLSFVNLSDVSIKVQDHFIFEDEDLERMAKSWPRLRALVLGTDCTDPSFRRISLTGFVTLLKQCRQLESLAIEVDFGGSYNCDGGGAWESPLSSLEVGRSPLEANCTATVSALLSARCPELRDMWYSEELVSSGHWDQVRFAVCHKLDELTDDEDEDEG